mmetsp:Transcript_124686/g.399477  ORF Transcript_124686/g.399477 Transcript_124686/m.399477 type:complete len:155 (-) Transcript_124686:14-478(-)
MCLAHSGGHCSSCRLVWTSTLVCALQPAWMSRSQWLKALQLFARWFEINDAQQRSKRSTHSHGAEQPSLQNYQLFRSTAHKFAKRYVVKGGAVVTCSSARACIEPLHDCFPIAKVCLGQHEVDLTTSSTCSRQQRLRSVQTSTSHHGCHVAVVA